MQSTRTVIISIFLISFLAILFLVWLIYFKAGAETDLPLVRHLSAANATLNGLSAICVYLGIHFIKQGKRVLHQRLMVTAFIFSLLFLVSYIIYHHFHGDTPFQGQGLIRPIYFFILISHIGLSVVVLPIVLVTFAFALLSKFVLHRRIARITFPLWLYVSITGVLVYAMLNHLPETLLQDEASLGVFSLNT
ncbi:MAG: DUF420 domain-containing protein [Candidatus Poribacteria bacterium]|nr:DUF420 domain-containing protein [Candidatus Poribacteria bacterium]